MSVGIRRRSVLSAALAGGLAWGLGRQAVAGMAGGAVRNQQSKPPGTGNFAADADAREMLLRYGGELGGNKAGKLGRQP